MQDSLIDFFFLVILSFYAEILNIEEKLHLFFMSVGHKELFEARSMIHQCEKFVV